MNTFGEVRVARTISIGAQGFEDLRKNGYFYMGKTGFVRDWWTSGDPVSLVYHPRRFGKTLNLDTVPRDHHKKGN